MNVFEWTIFCSLSLLVIGYLLFLKKCSLQAIIQSGLILLFVWLALDQVSQFYTYDETYAFWEIVSSKTAFPQQWSFGALRTTDAVIGSLMHVLRIVTRWPFEYYQMTAKIVHVVFGLLLFMALGEIIRRKFLDQKAGDVFFPLYLIVAGLLPVTLLSLKILNYDLFSVLLGAFSIVFLGIGLRQKGGFWILLSVIAAFFAAQEKLIAAPILWIGIFAYAWLQAEKAYSCKASSYAAKFLCGFAGVFLLTVSANVFTYLILWLNRFGSMPTSLLYPHVFLSPFSSALWPVMRALGGDAFIKQYGAFEQAQPYIWLLSFIALVFLGAGLAAFVSFYGKKAFPIIRKIPLIQGILSARNTSSLNFGLFLIALVVAIITAYSVNGYLSSFVSIQAAAYHPSASFNQNILHFGARTMLGHYVLQTVWAYLDFIISFPTALVLILLWCGVSDVRERLSGNKRAQFPIFFDAVIFVCLLMPLVYAITQTPTSSRYFNLFVFLIACITSFRFSLYLGRFNGWVRGMVCCAVFILTIAEILPFKPLYGAFRPWWYVFNREFNSAPETAVFKQVWRGWGEELMLAGEWIKKYEKNTGTQHRPIALYMNYLGEWFGKGPYVKTYSMLLSSNKLGYTANDYYIINRAGLLQDCGAFPKSIIPLHIISYRGFDQAWIYRGDLLANAGFRFPEKDISQ